MIITSGITRWSLGGRSSRLLRALDERCRSRVVNHPGAKRRRSRALARTDQPSMRRPLRSAILDPHAVLVSRATLDGPPYRGAGTASATTALPLEARPKPGHRCACRLSATTVAGAGGRADRGTGGHAGGVLQHGEPLRGWRCADPLRLRSQRRDRAGDFAGIGFRAADYARRVLVGRDSERAAVAVLLDQARASRGAALVLRGLAGVGKSALMDDVVSAAEGLLVLRTSGIESESPLAFAALQRLLRPVMALADRLPALQATALRTAFGEE